MITEPERRAPDPAGLVTLRTAHHSGQHTVPGTLDSDQ